MKYRIVAFIVFLLCLHAFAEEPAVIQDTRKLFLQIEDMIKKDNLYKVKIIVNESDFNLAGFGKYNKKYEIYYRIEEGRILSAAKIKLDYQISGSKFSEDYIFNEDGVLQFVYLSRGPENIEERFYFNMGKISVIIYDKPDASGKISRQILDKFSGKDINRSELVITEAESLLKFIAELPGGAALK